MFVRLDNYNTSFLKILLIKIGCKLQVKKKILLVYISFRTNLSIALFTGGEPIYLEELMERFTSLPTVVEDLGEIPVHLYNPAHVTSRQILYSSQRVYT